MHALSLFEFLLLWRDIMMTTMLTEETMQLKLTYNFKGLVHYNHGGAWQHAKRHGIGERADRSTSWSTGSIRRDCHTGHGLSIYDTQSPTPQYYTSSSKATSTPIRLHFLMELFPMGQAFIHMNIIIFCFTQCSIMRYQLLFFQVLPTSFLWIHFLYMSH